MPAELPAELRIGHLTYTVTRDDSVINRQSVRDQADYAGFSRSSTQEIRLAATHHDGNEPLGADYLRETLLHEILHQCLQVTGVQPDDDAKAGCTDVEERAVKAIAGPLLGVLRDHPELVDFLLDD